MSDAFKCDRCSSLAAGEPPNTISIENRKSGVPVLGDPHIREGDRELCEECSRELMRWLDE